MSNKQPSKYEPWISGTLRRLQPIVYFFVVVMIILTIIYSGILILSIKELAGLAYDNQQALMSDSTIVPLDSYSTDGFGHWNATVHTDGEMNIVSGSSTSVVTSGAGATISGSSVDVTNGNELVLKDVELTYSLRVNNTREAAYYSVSENMIIQIVGQEYYLDFLEGNNIVLALIGYFILLILVVYMRKVPEYGFISRKSTRIFVYGLGVLLFIVLLVGFIIFTI